MTSRTKFVKDYAARSGLSDEWAGLGFIDVESRVLIALPCGCDDQGCEGWAMVSAESALSHLELYAPASIRTAYREYIASKDEA